MELNLEVIKQQQKELSELIGAPGYEDEVRDYIINKIKPFVDKYWVDPLGNVLAVQEGPEGSERIMLDAHMDEVGFMVNHVEPQGFLRIINLGGYDTRILLGKSVIVRTSEGKKYHGVIGSTPPHLLTEASRKKPVDYADLYVDVGMKSKEEVMEAGIDIGTTLVMYDPFVEMPNNIIRGKAFDDRTGCNILLMLIKHYKNNPPGKTILYSFSVQEEVGTRGAGPSAYTLNPDFAIIVENTTAADVPGVPSSRCPVKFNLGSSISVADRSMVASPHLNRRLIENAKKEQIPFQIKKPAFGGTNAGRIHLTRGGIRSAVVSVPARYIHSSVSMLNMEDLLAGIRLIEAAIRNPANI